MRAAHGAYTRERALCVSHPGRLVRAAAWYRFGRGGRNYCPADSTRIVDTSACQSAAAATGMSWGGNSSSTNTSPKGCYVYSDHVYFNEYEPRDILSSFSVPLCFAGHTGAPVSGVDSISMPLESGSTWTWSCSAQCNSDPCSIQAAGLRLVGPLTPLIGRLQCRNEIEEM